MKELIQTRLLATVIGSKVPQTPKMAESMKSDSVLFGDRQTFAVECRILYETNTPSSNAAGSLWFWIGSQEVGNKHVVSLPGIAANELNQTLRWCGARHERRLFDADATTVLDIIDRGLYGRSEESDVGRWQRFLICMLPGGHPYIDGWLVVMIEGPDGATPRRDRVLCRGAALPKDREVWVPHGAYRAAVEEFSAWLTQRQSTPRS